MLQRLFQKGRSPAIALLAFLLSTSVFAQEDDAIQAGQKIAKEGVTGVPACSSCHGQNGEGNHVAGFPALAGMDATYFTKQFKDMRSGTRAVNPSMKPAVDGLNEDQIKAVAAYYASLEVVAVAGDAKLAERGKQLVERGDYDRGLVACSACHGPDGLGVNNNFPRISGQGAPYIKAQIEAWKKGDRKNDINGLMGAVAKQLADEDILAIGAYLQGVKPVKEAQ
jgi:cytochrome c553